MMHGMIAAMAIRVPRRLFGICTKMLKACTCGEYLFDNTRHGKFYYQACRMLLLLTDMALNKHKLAIYA
jgi:hypothetical protein